MVKIGRRGSMNGLLTVTGIQGHTAYPHLADNPAHRLVKMLSALIAEPLDRGNERFPPSDLQISTIDVGNPTTNVIPGARRPPSTSASTTMDSAKLTEWLKAKLDAAGGRYKLDIQVSGESFLTPPGRSEHHPGARHRRGDGPDARALAPPAAPRMRASSSAYCPVAEFGLVGLTMHKVDERVTVADIAALTKIYRDILTRQFQPALEQEERVAVGGGPERAPRAAMTEIEIAERVAVEQRETPCAVQRLPDLGEARHQFFVK